MRNKEPTIEDMKNIGELGKGFASILLGNTLLQNHNRKEVIQMETKSRYEVIADLESQKRSLIKERDGLNDVLLSKKKELRDLEREVDDTEEEISNFEKSMVEKKATITELISSIDLSLKRLSETQQKK